LIKIILNPDSYPLTLPGLTLSPKTAQPDLELALQLLEENADKVDPLDILSAFPDEVAVSRLHKFLSVALQKVLQNRRQVFHTCISEKVAINSEQIRNNCSKVCSTPNTYSAKK